jgi:hypothetical protein
MAREMGRHSALVLKARLSDCRRPRKGDSSKTCSLKVISPDTLLIVNTSVIVTPLKKFSTRWDRIFSQKLKDTQLDKGHFISVLN